MSLTTAALLRQISLRFLTTTYVQTYRLPSPLLIYQLALMPGSFLVGFLLSPILYLSRYISQKPSHRLRFPEEKNRHRRFLALGFYLGTLLIVGGLIGFWSKWQLDWRDPWVWIVLWVLEGSHWWSRPALLAYWAVLASISVTGWELQLAKTRHKRPWSTVGPPGRDAGGSPVSAAGKGSTGRTASTASTRTSTGPLSLPAGAREGGTTGGTYRPTAVMARVPILSLNGRRKFFHGLAILMFVPGIYFDVSPRSAGLPLCCRCSDYLTPFSTLYRCSRPSPTLRSRSRLRFSSLPNTFATLRFTRSASWSISS